MISKNLQIRLANHPDGVIKSSDFKKSEISIPKIDDNSVLIRSIYLSIDPYIRPMMDPVRSYVPHLMPGDLIPGFGVGIVEVSKSKQIPEGTIVTGRFGWQQYISLRETDVRIVDTALAPISTALGVLGMPGATAHYGLLEICRPIHGETIVVDAATGTVGSLVGQIGKIKGCRVIGIAGGSEKCQYATQVLGFDYCLDYKSKDFERSFSDATDNYVNVAFENVGGSIMLMILKRLAPHARIALCGAISGYNESDKNVNSFDVFELVRQRVRLQGFIISEHMEYWPKAFSDISKWIKNGQIKYKEELSVGLEAAPASLIKMLSGNTFGKQIIQISPAV